MGKYDQLRNRLGSPAAFVASFIGGIIGLTLLFWMALSLVYAIPSDALRGNVESSKVIVEAEGYYPHSYVNGKDLDNFTVGVMLDQALVGEGNPFFDSLNSDGYSKYWHGYLVYLKPLLLVFDLRQIRMIFLALFSILLFMASGLLWKKLGKVGLIAAVGLVAAEALFGGFDAAVTLPMFPSFALSLFGVIWILSRKDDNAYVLRCGFFLIGALTSFFDFLDNPLLTFGIPAAVYVLDSYCAGEFGKKNFGLIVVCGLMWAAGYGVLWSMKWILGSIVLGTNVIANALDTLGFRMNMGDEASKYEITAWGAIKKNVATIAWLRYVVLGSAFIGMATSSMRLVKAKKADRASIALAIGALVAISVLPFIWYAVVSNHSVIHSSFIAYRNLLLTLFGFWCLIAIGLADCRERR